MLGAIIGDIVGSPYEFDFNNIKTTNFPLFNEKSQFTDDSVMTIAVSEGLIESFGSSDEVVSKTIIEKMKYYGSLYPNAGYGGNFGAWLKTDNSKPYNSYGNGSAMRVSSVAWIFNTLDEVLHFAKLTAEVTHNHPEGIKGAQAAASAIFLSRIGKTKTEIKEYIEDNFGYDLKRSLDEIRPNYHHVESCQETVPEAIIAFLESDSFEDSIKKAVSLGGDSDTLTAITGSISEAFYGEIDTEISQKAISLMDETLINSYNRFCDFILERAVLFTTLKHEGQKRIGGDDYISHPIAVSEKLKEMGYSLNYQLVSLFHDLLEDTDASFDEIIKYSSHYVANAVELLTKQTGYNMEDYISYIKQNNIALAVKLADRLHNLECSVVADVQFRKKYIKETIDYYIPLSKKSNFEYKLSKAVEDLAKTLEKPYIEPLYKYIEYFNSSHDYKSGGGKQKDGTIQFPYPIYDNELESFINDCYMLGVIDTNYGATIKKYNLEQNSELKNEIDLANMELLLAILTCYVRGERFCDGMWAKAVKDGVFLSLLNRLKELSEMMVD